MKRFIAVLLALTFVFALAACGSSSGITNTPAEPAATSDNGGTEPAAAGSTIKLTYATAEQANMAAGQTSYWVVDQIESGDGQDDDWDWGFSAERDEIDPDDDFTGEVSY